MQYQTNQTCCNNTASGCYTGCGQTMPIVPGSNPALQTWNGQNFVVADGSIQTPIYLPNLQKSESIASYVVGSDLYGKISYYPSSSFIPNNNYGAFLSTTTQVSGGATSANLVGINTTDVSNGITLESNGKITFSQTGVYLINFLGQFKFSGGGTGGNITVWYSVNGSAAINSSYTFYLPTNNNYQLLANVEDINLFNSGDYIQFYWWCDINPASNISLYYNAAGSNPTRPASPSVNININQIK
jgi:hypothetical protein